jgi:hypothetical protein
VTASPLRPRDRQGSGITAAGRLAHPRNAFRRFTSVRHHGASTASSRPALTEARRHQPTASASRPVNSGPRPCLIDVGFPLSGPQDRTHTSDLNAMPGTPARPVALRAPRLPTTAVRPCCRSPDLTQNIGQNPTRSSPPARTRARRCTSASGRGRRHAEGDQALLRGTDRAHRTRRRDRHQAAARRLGVLEHQGLRALGESGLAVLDRGADDQDRPQGGRSDPRGRMEAGRRPPRRRRGADRRDPPTAAGG